MFRIGEFSLLAKVTVKALRYYDKIGLLKPAFIDVNTSYRYYTEEQLETVRKILTYKQVGISNSDILKVLKDESQEKAVLMAQKGQLLMQFEDTKCKIESLEKLITGNKQEYSATIKKVDSVPVYYSYGYVSGEESIHDFIKTCNAQFKKLYPQITFPEHDYCCVVYHGDGYRESNMFIEYAQSVNSLGAESPTIKFKTLEKITAISVVHRGEYENLRDAYAFAIEWASKNGYVVCGDARERYVKGSWNCLDVSEWITELQIPVKEQVNK